MDKPEDRNKQRSVSEDKLDEDVLLQLFGSRRVFEALGEEPRRRAELPWKVMVEEKAAEHFRDGNEAMQEARFQQAVVIFSRAIGLQPQQVQLHVRQGEAFLQLCDFQSAAACYRRARLLQPGDFQDRLAFICYLQGQCLFDGGLFLEALEAFSRATELKPDCRVYEMRSLACLTAAGRLGDCLQLLNDWIRKSPSADLHVVRARLHQRLNQASLCCADVMSALTLSPGLKPAAVLLRRLRRDGEDARQRAVDRTLRGQRHLALCLLNAALESCPQDARLYLFRGTLHRHLKDFSAAMEDLVQAVELSREKDQENQEGGTTGPAGATCDESIGEEAHLQMVLTYNDLAVEVFSRGLYDEATLLLNKAIEEEKSQASLYLNRGDCFFRLGDWCYALADYQLAEEMLGSRDPAVRNRLAVTHNTLGCLSFQDGHFQEAAGSFSQALLYDPTAAQYYQNRLKALRKIQNLKGAREDFICLLILDPGSEEVQALMSLFPGSSESDVLSSPKGRAVRAQLMDTIQTWTSSCGPRRSETSERQMN